MRSFKRFHYLAGGALSLVAAVALVLALGASAQADQIDFGVPAVSGGSVSYAGGATPLVISGVSVTSITDLATTTSVGSTATLALTSGNETSFSSGPPATLQFGANNTAGAVTITGTAPGAGITSSTTLLTGTVSSATVTSSSTSTAVAISTIINQLDPTLLSFFTGSSSGNMFDGALNLSFTLNSGGVNANGFTGTSASGDLIDTPTPEPGSLALIGLGLALVGTAVIKRRNDPLTA